MSTFAIYLGSEPPEIVYGWMAVNSKRPLSGPNGDLLTLVELQSRAGARGAERGDLTLSCGVVFTRSADLLVSCS